MSHLYGTVKVMNTPEYAKGKYMVVSLVNSQLWFYAAYEDEQTAERVARDEGKLVVKEINT